MTIAAGQRLLQYRLVEQIGEGGMGVVWKALDTTLDREVAIKFLPSGFAGEPGRLARFGREARLASLYLDRFPERGEKFRVSADGGSWPVWRRDGRSCSTCRSLAI